MSFVRVFDELFAGRRDVYAEGYPDPHKPEKNRYRTVEEELTREVLANHLKGELTVGVYPVLTDNTVHWFAVDFDAPKDAKGNTVPDPFPIAWEAAKLQAEAFETAGLHVYLERSRSGNGVHVWGFLDKPLPARTVRLALKPLLTDHTIFTSRDRLFPVQDELSGEKKFGNLIALPYFNGAANGNSTFLDPDTQDPIPARAFVASVRKNAPAVVEALAAEAAAKEPRRVRGVIEIGDPATDYRPEKPLLGALKMISKYGCPFMHYAWVNRRTLPEPLWYPAIGQCTAFKYGLDLAHLISRDYKNYTPGEVDSKYEQALKNPPVGYGWLTENFPEIVGTKHNGKAPYHEAKKTIADLMAGSQEDMVHVGPFEDDVARIRQLDAREISSGVPWGFPGLDDFVRLRGSEMTVVGGMQSLGKTAFMVDGVIRLARAGVHAFVFSAETGRTSLRQRLIARAAEVDSRALRGERQGRMTSEEWERVEQAAAELAELPIYENYTALDANTVLAQVETVMLSRRIPLDSDYVIFFDYLQFGSKMPGDDTEYARLSRLSGDFKFTAKILEHPVVVFSQLKREMEGNDSPQINWFKGTGRIESDMDVGLIITGDRAQGAIAPRSITVVKQRESEANMSFKFFLQQQFSRWDENEQATSEEREAKTIFGQ